MAGSWDEMRRGKEESYFEKRNKEALERMSKNKAATPRLSPVSGQPMEQIVLHGVVIDRCPTSGGIWLDAGELEQLIEAQAIEKVDQQTWWTNFLKGLKK